MTLDQIKAFFGDLARPFALYVTFGSAAIATVRLAWAGGDLNSAAIFIGAVLAGGGAIYGAKAAEETRKSGHAAEVKKAEVSAAPPPGTAQITAAPDVDVTVREAGPEPVGDAPPWERRP